MTYQLHHGNCIDIMPLIERESVDAVICDPPYGLSFMGKDWDHGVPGEHFWREAYRCAKPGAYLLAFGGTRTFHRLAVAIEDAGWEIRDTVMWVYGQGFPKSHDVSKAIDREAGAEREVIGVKNNTYDGANRNPANHHSPAELSNIGQWGLTSTPHGLPDTSPATPAAAEWDGWGTALKPAWEPIIVARKPLVGTVAENVQRYGTGAMNIDGCRIESGDQWYFEHTEKTSRSAGIMGNTSGARQGIEQANPLGRWPANLIHDGSAEVLAGFPSARSAYPGNQQAADDYAGTETPLNGVTNFGGKFAGLSRSDVGSAARFFYCAKASKADRDEGCEGLELRESTARQVASEWKVDDRSPDGGYETAPQTKARNHHPTVKPTSLMRYLCRLVTPPQGVILDPFMGSGSTGKAAMLEGFDFIGIDTEIEYVEIAARRIEHACEKVGIVVEQPMMFETKRETVDRPKQLMLI